MINIEKLNNVYCRIHAPADLKQEISDVFSFRPEGYQFIPSFKKGYWDGYIRLFNTKTSTIYAGLGRKVAAYLRSREIEVEFEEDSEDEFSIYEATQFAHSLELPFEPRDFQLEAFVRAIRKRRALFLSPTASGKSLIVYLTTRLLNSRGSNVLIVVPTVGLVHQLASDFRTYGCTLPIAEVRGGVDPDEVRDAIVISTWQSIYKLEQPWFDRYKCLIGDEAHLFTAESLTNIAAKSINADYRIGVTGTLEDAKMNQMVLEGIFGEVIKVANTKDLQDDGVLSAMDIKVIVLKYPKELCKKRDYDEEKDFITTNAARNNFIINLSLSLKGVTLVLFHKIEHGKMLYKEISKKSKYETHFVYGEIDGAKREEIRQKLMNSNDAIIVASYGTFSLGINIPNIHNIVFASFFKSRIINLQSIGRGLRTHDSKEKLQLFDIGDETTSGKAKSYSIQHLERRLQIYTQEQFEFKLYKVDLKCN